MLLTFRDTENLNHESQVIRLQTTPRNYEETITGGVNDPV